MALCRHLLSNQPQQTKGHTILPGKSTPQLASATSGIPTISVLDPNSQDGDGNSEAGEVGAGEDGTGGIRAEDIDTKDAETMTNRLAPAAKRTQARPSTAVTELFRIE